MMDGFKWNLFSKSSYWFMNVTVHQAFLNLGHFKLLDTSTSLWAYLKLRSQNFVNLMTEGLINTD